MWKGYNMNKETVLTAKDLCKTFSNESVQQHVLKNLNLSIYKGDFTVVMGNSGSGKSTLLYALSGMDRPSLGTVTYNVKEGNIVSRFQNFLMINWHFSEGITRALYSSRTT